MELDAKSLDPRTCYKLLTCLVVPRPIALVTTLDPAGVVNAAPFSFFNVMGADPPIVVLGIGNRDEGGPKDTAANIRASGEFVIQVVTESIAEAMNITATDFPTGVSELPASGLTTVPSSRVRPPRIAESPVHFECREVQTVAIGRTRIVMGEVLHFQVRDDLIDRQKMHVKTEAIRAVGRMHPPSWYTRTTDLFELHRLSYAQLEAASESRSKS